MSKSDINSRFDYHPPKGDTTRKAHEDARAEVKILAGYFDEELPDGREKALALTKLEEALFWANAAIARE